MTRRSLFGTVLGAVGAAVTSAFVPKSKMYEIWERDYQFEHSTELVDFFMINTYKYPNGNTGYSWATKSYYYPGSKFQPKLFTKGEAEKVIKEIVNYSHGRWRFRGIRMQEVSAS